MDVLLLPMKSIKNLLHSSLNELIELRGKELYQLDADPTKATSKHLQRAASFTFSSSIALLYFMMKAFESPILFYASKGRESLKDQGIGDSLIHLVNRLSVLM